MILQLIVPIIYISFKNDEKNDKNDLLSSFENFK